MIASAGIGSRTIGRSCMWFGELVRNGLMYYWAFLHGFMVLVRIDVIGICLLGSLLALEW